MGTKTATQNLQKTYAAPLYATYRNKIPLTSGTSTFFRATGQLQKYDLIINVNTFIHIQSKILTW